VALRHQIARFTTSVEGRSNWPLEAEWWWSIPIGPDAVWLAGSIAMAVLASLGARLLGGQLRTQQEALS
jgi:hypothetical protein